MSFQIETERLILRDVREGDLPVLIAQAQEPEARRGILAYQADENYNRVCLLAAIAEARTVRRVNYTLSVVLKSEQSLIGSCSIANVKMDSIESSLGWHYGRQYWGSGYATEAARALLEIGFGLHRAAEIYADCFADNFASIRIMQKIGMTSRRNLGLFNEIRGWSYGENRPTVRYTISRREWLAGKKK